MYTWNRNKQRVRLNEAPAPNPARMKLIPCKVEERRNAGTRDTGSGLNIMQLVCSICSYNAMAADSASALLRGQAKGLGGSSWIAFMRDQNWDEFTNTSNKKESFCPSDKFGGGDTTGQSTGARLISLLWSFVAKNGAQVTKGWRYNMKCVQWWWVTCALCRRTRLLTGNFVKRWRTDSPWLVTASTEE